MTEENKVNPEDASASGSTPEAAKPASEAEATTEAPAAKQSAETASEAPAAKPAAEPKADAPVVKPASAKPAAAKHEAAPAEEKPDPKKEAAQQKLELFRKKIVEKFGEGVLEEASLAKYQPTYVIKKENWREVAEFLRHDTDCLFDYPEVMAGTDYKEKGYIEVVVYLQSIRLGNFITIKTRTPRESASVPSLVPVFNGVNWEEREIFDLLGVTFTGHPDLRRIMMPDDYEGHPLRKDFSVWKE